MKEPIRDDSLKTLVDGAPSAPRDKGRSSPSSVFHADLVHGTGPRFETETHELLRTRLKAFSVVLVALLTVGEARRSYFEGPLGLYGLPIAVIALVGIAALILFKRETLSSATLRAIELSMVWGVAASFGFQMIARFLSAVSLNPETVDASLDRGLLAFFAICLIYGMFIPNHWKRTLWVTGGVALVPIICRALLRLQFPDLGPLTSPDEISQNLFILVSGVAVAAYGSFTTGRLRKEAFEARRLGQYQLVKRIGVGGMGEVWTARHRMLARPAAIKLIRPEMLGADTGEAHMVVRRFEREAQVTASLSSPHTVMLYDFGISDDGVFYYVMELLDGLDLESLVEREGPLDARLAAHILVQACDSLAEAHGRGLIHRDIKPANIYLCLVGRTPDFVKVLDFGLVKFEQEATQADTTRLTQQGMTAGTPAYMAPEQVIDGRTDAQTDIYSLGCVAYWLVTGKLVFDASSAMAVVIDHARTPPTPPSQRTERQIPTCLEDIIMSCLEKDPAKRPQGAEELAAKLRSCQQKIGVWTEREAPLS